jgi:hypothetical protein
LPPFTFECGNGGQGRIFGNGKELLIKEGKVLRGENQSIGGFIAGGEAWGAVIS